MDVVKVDAGIPRHLHQLIRIVQLHTTDIKMKFALDKCQTLNIRRGKVEIEGDQDKVIYIYINNRANECN